MNPSQRNFKRDINFSLLMLVLAAVVFLLYVIAEKRIDRANDLRHTSYLLADELRQSSDDLTRMARSYVITRDRKFKTQYLTVLDIRDGKLPRPDSYARVYWDFMLDNSKPPRPASGNPVPLIELMRQAGFSKAELDKLAEAKAKSDQLAKLELESFRLVEAAGADAEIFWVKALQMLHDERYHEAKAGIMKPIDDCFVMFEKRTKDSVTDAEIRALILRFVFLAFVLSTLFMLWNAYRELRVILGGRPEDVMEQIVRMGQGDFTTPITVVDGSVQSVMKSLAETQAKLLNIDNERKRIQQEQMLTENERLMLERQLLNAQKLESLGVLAGGIAHDFNNILAVIIGNCGLAAMYPQHAACYIPEIERASDRAATLCRQMLAYAGKSNFVMAVVNIVPLVDEIAGMLTTTLPQNSKILFETPDRDLYVQGDAGQLTQVVMNLMINASEAIGDKNGLIHVSLDSVGVNSTGTLTDCLGKAVLPGRYVRLKVSDTGCGMDSETQARVFEPFFTTKFTGRGLGMSAVLGIISSHGGSLQIFSKPGEGTVFTVYVPEHYIDVATDVTHRSSVDDKWSGSGTVLLVDDENNVRILLKHMMIKIGYSVLEASNGEEALEIFRNNSSVSLVITDIGMPVMDGYALIHELKTLKPNLPIVISSGFGDVEVSSKISPDDMAGIICKPYRFEDLREMLAKIEQYNLGPQKTRIPQTACVIAT